VLIPRAFSTEARSELPEFLLDDLLFPHPPTEIADKAITHTAKDKNFFRFIISPVEKGLFPSLRA
jgi:hypothetical protein